MLLEHTVFHRRYLWVILASALAGSLLVWLSMSSGERPDRLEQSIGRGLAMLQGQEYVQGEYRFYMPMFQNRILVPAAQTVLMALGLPSVPAFVLIYAATAWVALVACWWLFFSLSCGRLPWVWFCWSCLAVAVGLTFIEPWLQATEFLELLFLAGMTLAVMHKWPAGLIGLALLGALNRETVVYGPMLWGLVHGLRPGRPKLVFRELFFALLVAALVYGFVLGVRYALGGDKGLEHFQTQTWWLNPNLFRHAMADLFGYGHWLIRAAWMLGLPLCLFLAVGAGRLPLAKRFFAMALLVVYAVYQHGVLHEIRLFLPAVLFLLGGVAVAVRKPQAAYP